MSSSGKRDSTSGKTEILVVVGVTLLYHYDPEFVTCPKATVDLNSAYFACLSRENLGYEHLLPLNSGSNFRPSIARATKEPFVSLLFVAKFELI